MGSYEQQSSDNQVSGRATLLFTAKGERKFMDVTVYVEKLPGIDWKVVDIE